MTGYTDGMVDRSVHEGDIDPNYAPDDIRRRIREDFHADSTVTVVLIGPCTWARKHVDWEISATLRDTKHNPRSGLLGILLPSHPNYYTDHYTPNLIPRRLHENVEIGYAKVYNWSNSPMEIKSWIHTAYQRRNQLPAPTYSTTDLFANNRSCDPSQPKGWSY